MGEGRVPFLRILDEALNHVSPYNRSPHAPLQVLVVDDDPLDRARMRQAMIGVGFNVVEVENGVDAIKLAEETSTVIDLAILDFQMPMLNGVETFVALRDLRPGLRAILCSGNAEPECFRGKVYNGLFYLQKGFSSSGLEDAVEAVLA
jgi:two-component system cell cycle sensor histidine kinase/response regulator CckA